MTTAVRHTPDNLSLFGLSEVRIGSETKDQKISIRSDIRFFQKLLGMKKGLFRSHAAFPMLLGLLEAAGVYTQFFHYSCGNNAYDVNGGHYSRESNCFLTK